MRIHKYNIMIYPGFVSYTLAFALHLRKKHGKTSVRVVKKCPDFPVAVPHSPGGCAPISRWLCPDLLVAVPRYPGGSALIS
jgi:hypothetical protein